jgi:hypothetical protein
LNPARLAAKTQFLLGSQGFLELPDSRRGRVAWYTAEIQTPDLATDAFFHQFPFQSRRRTQLVTLFSGTEKQLICVSFVLQHQGRTQGFAAASNLINPRRIAS